MAVADINAFLQVSCTLNWTVHGFGGDRCCRMPRTCGILICVSSIVVTNVVLFEVMFSWFFHGVAYVNDVLGIQSMQLDTSSRPAGGDIRPGAR